VAIGMEIGRETGMSPYSWELQEKIMSEGVTGKIMLEGSQEKTMLQEIRRN